MEIPAKNSRAAVNHASALDCQAVTKRKPAGVYFQDGKNIGDTSPRSGGSYCSFGFAERLQAGPGTFSMC